MTLDGWLDARRPAPPDALRARIRSALGPLLESEASQATDACLRASERLVESLLLSDNTTRDSALDLLAADALVTYAFEAASERPSELVALAHDAMIRMAALGSVRAPGAPA